MSRRRVVVTGMGMLSPLGNDVPSSWQGILAGRSGIGLLEHMDLSAYSTRFGGAVKNFNVEEYLSAKEARKLDLFIQYGLGASFQAMRNSGLEVTDANRERIGVAMGSGTDVAIESAGVTLLKGDLTGIVRARHLSKATMRNIRQNLFFAFAYNVAGIPIAAGALYPVFGLLLSPIIAAAAMALSSVSVIGNALRLKRVEI